MKRLKLGAFMLSLTGMLLGCTTEEETSVSAGANNGGGEGDAGDEPVQPTNSAILIAGQVYNPGDEYLTYVGIFPEVPEGNVSFGGNFREFGNANTFVHEGRVFVEQDGVMERFDVSEDLQLVAGDPPNRFSWTEFGIAGANSSYSVFISATRAYTFSPDLGVIVVWNPDTMRRTGVIDLEYPERPEGMETWASDGYVIGDKVVWNVFSGNFDTAKPYPAITLAIADAHSDAPVTFVEDPRCLPGGPSFLDENGDYYVHGAGFFGYFYAYGEFPEDTGTCVLRMNAGESEIDPDYRLDYEEATGSPVSTFWIGMNDDQYLTYSWDPSVPYPESPDDFWTGEGLHPILVDLAEGTAEPYPDLEAFSDIDGRTRIIDGVSYFQASETGYDVGGNTDVVELHPDGIRQKFHLNAGFLLELERVR